MSAEVRALLAERAREAIRQIDAEEAELAHIERTLERRIAERESFQAHTELLERVRVFVQGLAEATRGEIVAGLEQIVTTCLQIMFGDTYRFEIEVETKRNQTTVEFYVVQDGGEHPVRLRPVGNMAGGILDTISIGLSFGILKVVPEPPDGPILFDEPAKMVSDDRAAGIIHLLVEMSRLFERQVILVTHHEHEEVIAATHRAFVFADGMAPSVVEGGAAR